jgi:hypothetical protein
LVQSFAPNGCGLSSIVFGTPTPWRDGRFGNALRTGPPTVFTCCNASAGNQRGW